MWPILDVESRHYPGVVWDFVGGWFRNPACGFVFDFAGTSRLRLAASPRGYAVTRRCDLACQGVVLDRIQVSARMPGFAALRRDK